MVVKVSSLASDFSLIRDAGAREHPAYKSFVKEMEGRDYGYEAINDAWDWFKVGWDACDSGSHDRLSQRRGVVARHVTAGILSVAVLAFAGTGLIAWDFANQLAACGFWVASVVTFGLVAVLLKGAV